MISFYDLEMLLDRISLIPSRCSSTTLADFIEKPIGSSFIFRCDVERDIRHHKWFAQKLESANVRASMYFHTRVGSYDEYIMAEIQGMGHEVGFHHECLDRCRGDFPAARELFLREVDLFRSAGFDLKSVCSHGENGIKKTSYLSNADLFRQYPNLLREAGLVEVYHWLADSGAIYYSDTFRSVAKFNDFLLDENSAQSDYRILMLLVHPHRWRGSRLHVAKEVLQDSLQFFLNKATGRRKYRLVHSL